MYSDGGLYRACRAFRVMYSDGGLYRVLMLKYADGGLNRAYIVLRFVDSI